ncbi:helix-turn-helix transcriptional regulator [Streptomyces sp. NPDC052071]|uniref:helix-turn-helix domain-containing protein n=1 Tax=Streptomyces sp. NPDC052071 TaxID=3156666 RepID=UPI0034461ECD
MAPIDDPNHGVGRLAQALRDGRSRRGLSRRQLAAEIDRSVTTIQRAEAGDVRPTLLVSQQIADACGIDHDEIEALWRKAARLGRGHRVTDAPRLKLVRTSADLAAALRRVWEENGEPSSRHMEERAEARAREFAPLSRMSAWRIRERKQPVTSVRQLYAYLIACEVPEGTFPAWAKAWQRAKRDDRWTPRIVPAPHPSHPRRRVTPSEAVDFMIRSGLRPIDPYPGHAAPWTAQCMACSSISRVRYSKVKTGAGGCRVCRRNQMAA